MTPAPHGAEPWDDHGALDPPWTAGGGPSGHRCQTWPRLHVPAALPTAHGCDAVGLPEQYGYQVMDILPRAGCVFADAERWWWVVPSQSDIGVSWPELVHYAYGACVTAPASGTTAPRAGDPGLTHWPDDDTVPYTHPLLLYIAVCKVAGVPPAWPRGGRLQPV